MSRHRLIALFAALGMATFAGARPAFAQVFGTFPWQMQPYCNIVTLTLTNTPAGFTLDGVDDQCGATNKASAVGVASFSAAGNVTVNFTIVTAPAAKPVHVAAVVSPANGNGTWTDSVGNSGTFAFFGATPGLPARPIPASGLPASIITTTEISAGAVGASDINTAEVQARVTGTCPAGQAVSAINANGTVVCASTEPRLIRGSYAVHFDARIANDRDSVSLSFGLTLPSAPTVHWRAVGAGPIPQCPGTPAMPLAAPGHLCVYTHLISNINVGGSCITNAGEGYSCGTSDPYGATLFVQAANEGQALITGSWAVSRP